MRGALAAALAGVALAAAAPASAAGPAQPYVVVYEPGVRAPAAATAARERRDGFRARERYDDAVDGFAATLTPAQAATLATDPAVRAVSPDRTVEAVADPPLAPGETAPPGVRRIAAATATTAGRASTAGVAVLDTGIDLDHPDLTVRAGTDCVAPGTAPDDDHGHGTHVAGTIAARNTGTGVVGVAPGTPVTAVKVLDAAGRGAWSNVLCGLDWAVATRTDADPANDVHVVNLSLSGGGDQTDTRACTAATSALHLAVCRAAAAGITVVAAAGNSGRSFERSTTPDVPAVYPEVLTVTAMTDTDGAPGGAGPGAVCGGAQADDRYASYSNYATSAAGAAHVLAGPGSCVLSTRAGGGTEVRTGTSMATPHVAGLAALCLGTTDGPGPCAGRTPAQVVGQLRAVGAARSAADPALGFAGDPGRPVTGRIYGHLGWTGAAAPPPPEPEPEPEPEPPTPPAQVTLAPVAVAVGTGLNPRGGVAELAAADGRAFVLDSSSGVSPLVSWTATFRDVPAAAATLALTYTGSETRACTRDLALMRWRDGAWTSAGSGLPAADYRSATGEVRARVRCAGSLIRFTASADLLALTARGSAP